jgi:hypothetical protein
MSSDTTRIVVANKVSRLANGWRLYDRRTYKLVPDAKDPDNRRMLVFYENSMRRGPAFTPTALDQFLRGVPIYTSHGRIEWRAVRVSDV